MFVLSNGDNNELRQNEKAENQNAAHVYVKCAFFFFKDVFL